jgi:hypothetical protein
MFTLLCELPSKKARALATAALHMTLDWPKRGVIVF